MSGERAGTWAFPLALAALVASALAFPLYQALDTGGYVYFVNAYDESTYLQYDFSKATQGIARPGQYLVTLGHELGLSGGWINALFDAVALGAFALLARAAFVRAGVAPPRAGLAALAMVCLPALFGTANPVVAWIHDRTNASDLVYWFNVPEMFVSPLVRSPEPQFSLTLAAAGSLAALWVGSAWPVLLLVPFMYPFVGLPAGFVAIALLLKAYWPFARLATAGPLIAGYLAIGIGAWAYYNVAVGDRMRAVMIDSHLPLVSFTGLVALAAFLALRPALDARWRFFALALALAPWVASNQQLISGHIPQPNNFEHYFGVFAIALIITLALVERPRWATAVMLAGALLLGRTAYVSFRVAQIDHQRYKPTPALLAALRDDPGAVVIDDGTLANTLNMVHPRQGSTALGFEQTFGTAADHRVVRYRCVKKRILAEHPADASLRAHLRWLDDGFMYGSQNVLVSHIKRKTTFTKLRDVDPALCPDDGPPLRYFWVR